jgi:hypothetical protein
MDAAKSFDEVKSIGAKMKTQAKKFQNTRTFTPSIHINCSLSIYSSFYLPFTGTEDMHT